MRVLLIMPTYYQDAKEREVSKQMPPVGLAYIASALEQIDCQVRIFDVMGRDSKIKKVIDEFNPDCIGICCFTPHYPHFVKTLKHIRVFYQKPIIAGGPHFHILEEALKSMKSLPLDLCIIGEGEKSFQEVIRRIESSGDFSGIDGTISKIDNKIVVGKSRKPIENLDEIRFPAWHLLELKNYKSLIMPIHTSRGCPYNCIYCYSGKIWGSKVRFRSPENVVDEMRTLSKNYSYSGFFISDDTFVLNSKRIKKFADLLEKENFQFICNGRINLMTDEIFKNLKRAGCIEVFYGIESAVQRILNNLKKNQLSDKIEEVIKKTREYGMKPSGYYMLSLPGESYEDMKTTINFANYLKRKYGGSGDFQWTRIYPGTELAEIAKLSKDHDWSVKLYHNLRWPNMPVYHELPFETVYKLFKKVNFSEVKYPIKQYLKNWLKAPIKKIPLLYHFLKGIMDYCRNRFYRRSLQSLYKREVIWESPNEKLSETKKEGPTKETLKEEEVSVR